MASEPVTDAGTGIGAYALLLVCAALAAWLVHDRQMRRRRARLLFAGSGPPSGAGDSADPFTARAAALHARWRGRAGGRIGREWLCLPAGAVIARLGESPLPLVAALLMVPFGRRFLRRREAGRARERRAAEVVEWCAAVAGGLRAGRQPLEALLAAPAAPGPRDAAIAAAARYGGDVPGALRQAAQEPGAEGLAGVAACWQAAAGTGAGLAAGLERVAGALRAERDQREDLRAQLAGTRTSALLLAALPGFGLLMGAALGAEPLRVLLHTPAGLGCLAVGGLLECAGLAWTARIVRAARSADGVPKPAARSSPVPARGLLPLGGTDATGRQPGSGHAVRAGTTGPGGAAAPRPDDRSAAWKHGGAAAVIRSRA
ncbi:hypothetical protein CRI70_16560 [Streptomyces sp. Ru87]|nr:hypothetical protein CRI70_16560 [Streptomyces sp. Ru87]